MYGLVPYQFSGTIHAGIQYGHAVVEYMLKHKESPKLIKWAEDDKTMIILNGGTTNLGDRGNCGTLNDHTSSLIENDIDISTFYEPDLGDQLTAVVFLVDERVWNKEKYPDFDYDFNNAVWSKKASQELQLEGWKKSIGGEQNVWLREFLKQFKLA